jgi:hypothetical protein
VHLPSIPTKHLDTISHTAISVLHVLPRRYDIVYICGVGNASLAWVPRLTGARSVLNVDSSDWRRAKWGRFASSYLRAMERLAADAVDAIVVDSQSIARRYREEHGVGAVFIPYGANVIQNEAVEGGHPLLERVMRAG